MLSIQFLVMFARNRAKERQVQFHIGAALSAQRGSWDAISTLEVRSIVFSSVVRFSYVCAALVWQHALLCGDLDKKIYGTL